MSKYNIKSWRDAAKRVPEGLIIDVKRHFIDVDNWAKAMKTLPLDSDISGGRFSLKSEMAKYIDEIERRQDDPDADRMFACDSSIKDLADAVKRAVKYIGKEKDDAEEEEQIADETRREGTADSGEVEDHPADSKFLDS